MSDETKLLVQAQVLRTMARQTRAMAHQLLQPRYRALVLGFADRANDHADELERLAAASRSPAAATPVTGA